MRTGDIVFHKPSGERWVVAWADHSSGYMSPCGWPTCQAKISDCELLATVSNAHHRSLVAEVNNSGRTDAHKARVSI